MAVERLGAGDLDAAAALLARAFADDPLLSFLLGPGREPELRLVLGALARDAVRAGVVEGLWAGGRLLGVAVWLPPGGHPLGLRREARLLPDWLQLAARRPGAVAPLARAGRALDRLHPEGPHWFLSLLAVEPEAQGRGVGREVVDAGLRRAGDVPVHLDTARPRNVEWYRRLGFEVEREIRAVRGAPPTWGMRTRP